MIRAIGILFILSSCGAAQGALLTNFAGSFAKYQSCSLLMPASKCYKLYCDPTGIEEGMITAYVDVPDPGAALSRFDIGSENGIAATHPAYSATLIGDPTFTKMSGRERYVAHVRFMLNAGMDPPTGEIVLFELHVHDALPSLGIADVQVGFEFNPGDFVTILDTGPPVQRTTFDHMQLTDVPMVLEIPEPGTLALTAWGAALWRFRPRRTSRLQGSFEGGFPL
jgi:hypothetical protein